MIDYINTFYFIHIISSSLIKQEAGCLNKRKLWKMYLILSGQKCL